MCSATGGIQNDSYNAVTSKEQHYSRPDSDQELFFMWENLQQQFMVGRKKGWERNTHQASQESRLASKQLLPLFLWENLLRGCAGFGWDSLGAQKDCFGLSPVSN